MIRPLDVIWIPDDTIRPPGPKMVVCVEPDLGFYFRFNTHDNWEPSVPIRRLPDHGFLQWDSFIQCRILDPDDYIIQRALRDRGVIGRVSPSLCDPLLEALGYAAGSRRDLNAIRVVLEQARNG